MNKQSIKRIKCMTYINITKGNNNIRISFQINNIKHNLLIIKN